ncbi:hypothetical protein A4S02_14020 (plasmid) [Acetobacter ascendens]|uniref:HEPN AbiU2-like domain-containing protein n=1 Tax=Acetobacter ascendens TaxID=481146 RepID=A0A1D8R044_9PROT|nr:hypothetical protein [Acetobacter ascendens]AOW47952.1 hypothetical protein A4S02_14020 [Acetobacter ascendens]
MTLEDQEIYLLQHSLYSLEEEYAGLSCSWESYKVFHEKYYLTHKYESLHSDFSIDIITGALVRDSWACMMRIWDKKSKGYNNMNMCSFYNAASKLKYDTHINSDERLFYKSKKIIRTIYNHNIRIVGNIKYIRNNFLSHKNIGDEKEIIELKDGRRLDQFQINHSIDEFDNLYLKTEEIISSCHELFGRKLNKQNLEMARTASIKGTDELIEKILYEQKKG